MGITQHVKGVSTVRLLANLLLLRGNVGRPGSNSHFVFLSMAGLCGIFGGTMGGVRAGQRSRRYWWRLREGESEQQVVP
jgi:anaerobic selenocysteine-containing dehydrogenase